MLPALDALLLDRAKLTREEKQATEQLLEEIDIYARSNMEHRGLYGFRTETTNGNVVAAANVKLRQLGYMTQWNPLMKPQGPNKEALHIGWTLTLNPSDQAYFEAAALEAN